MGTTLWFDEHHRNEKTKEAIIATGSFTNCYNLLRHLNKKTGLSTEELLLKQKLINDWERFCTDPYFLQGQLN